MPKKYWNDTDAYRRILEILDEYWLTEPDEEYVRVEMYFRHSNGEEQTKCIAWKNPNSI